MFVTSNPKNPAEYVIAVDQASWFFSKQYYNDANVVSAYKQYITRVAEYMGADKANSAYQTEVNEMYQLETEFVKVRVPRSFHEKEVTRRDCFYALSCCSQRKKSVI